MAERMAVFERSGPPEAATLWRQVQQRFARLEPGSEN
ncbi:hypothetical protein [Qipengyuania spongiae]